MEHQTQIIAIISLLVFLVNYHILGLVLNRSGIELSNPWLMTVAFLGVMSPYIIFLWKIGDLLSLKHPKIKKIIHHTLKYMWILGMIATIVNFIIYYYCILQNYIRHLS